MIWAYAAIGLILLITAGTARYMFYRFGQKEERLKQSEETVNAVLKSKKAITSLDDDKRKRLRDKYKYRP